LITKDPFLATQTGSSPLPTHSCPVSLHLLSSLTTHTSPASLLSKAVLYCSILLLFCLLLLYYSSSLNCTSLSSTTLLVFYSPFVSFLTPLSLSTPIPTSLHELHLSIPSLSAKMLVVLPPLMSHLPISSLILKDSLLSPTSLTFPPYLLDVRKMVFLIPFSYPFLSPALSPTTIRQLCFYWLNHLLFS
jgi:hypothetical protein